MKSYGGLSNILALLFFVLPGMAPAAPAGDSCAGAYAELYQKNEIHISVYFGYSNYIDHVGDGEERDHLRDVLLTRCERGQFNCGFKKWGGDIDLLGKTIRGPDGRMKRVYLRMMNSSMSSRHEDNISRHAEAQKQKSLETEAAFQRSLAGDDVVFYSGHARYGTGISFTPMNYDQWNEALRDSPALDRMVETLKRTPTPPKLLGIVACKSEAYYAEVLHRAAPRMGLILTRETLQANDSMRTLDAALDSILGLKCAPAFRKALNDSTHFFYYNPLSIKKRTYGDMVPEIYNFFEPVTKSFSFSPNLIKTEIVNTLEKDRQVMPEGRDNGAVVGPE